MSPLFWLTRTDASFPTAAHMRSDRSFFSRLSSASQAMITSWAASRRGSWRWAEEAASSRLSYSSALRLMPVFSSLDHGDIWLTYTVAKSDLLLWHSLLQEEPDLGNLGLSQPGVARLRPPGPLMLANTALLNHVLHVVLVGSQAQMLHHPAVNRDSTATWVIDIPHPVAKNLVPRPLTTRGHWKTTSM